MAEANPTRSRLLLAAVALLYALILATPLWITTMEAPQYRGEEALEVRVLPGRVHGDTEEITILNQYVGVRLPLDGPEVAWSGWGFVALLALAVAAALVPAGRRRFAAMVLVAASLAVGVAGVGVLQYRLWEMGHVRGHPVIEGVEDFTPPVFGWIHVANFDATMVPGVGGVAFGLALVLSFLALRLAPRGHEREGGRRPPAAAVLLIAGCSALLLGLFAAGLVLIPRFQAANPPTELQRSDADRVTLDDLFLDLTLVTPRFLESRKLGRHLGERDPDSVLPVLVGINTHTGTIEHMHHVAPHLSMLGPDGRRYPSVGEPIVLSQHHNAYMVLFPARDHQGARFLDLESGTLAVEADGLGQVARRHYEWQLPIADSVGAGTWAARIALALALVSGLIVVLSPCALELTLYYTAIISCTVAEGEREAARQAGFDPNVVGRRRVLLNLGAFVCGFTLLYAASGATVGLIGQGVRQPLGAWGGALQVAGGLLILFFAVRVAGIDRWLGARLSSLLGRPAAVAGHSPGLVTRLLDGLRRRGQRQGEAGASLRARDSFLVGMGLSSACLTCMGGAVLYPLLVFAGITSWYSGLVTLTLYSLGIALPMVLIALGLFRIRLSLSHKLGWNRALRYASAAMLAAIGLLILSGYERVITDLTFRTLAMASRWAA